MRIEDTAAVITGGASGLGRAVAERIVARGGRAVIVDVQDEAGRAAAKEIGATFVYQGHRVRFVWQSPQARSSVAATVAGG